MNIIFNLQQFNIRLSINEKLEPVEVSGRGRHDPCVLPRAVPIVEAMTALVLADHLLRNRLSRLEVI